MDDKYRNLKVEHRLTNLDIHYYCHNGVPLAEILDDANPARWKARFDPLHVTEIGCAMIDKQPVPAFLLYKPPGAAKYVRLGGMHRYEACKEVKLTSWPAYVIDVPLSDFMLELLPIWTTSVPARDTPRTRS